MSNNIEPKGVGIYIRQLSEKIHGTPVQASRTAKKNGISFVVIKAIEQTKKCVSILSNGLYPTKLFQYATEFKRQDIDVWIWGMPWVYQEDEFVDRMQTILMSDIISGTLLDPEVGYKPKKSGISDKKAIKDHASYLVRESIDILSEDEGIGMTSYGFPKMHKSFPWKEFIVGFGSPQLYRTPTKNMVERSIEEWKDLGFKTLLPSVPTFGLNSETKLDDFLQWFPRNEIQGFIFWSWMQTNKIEWETIKKWSGKAW